MRRNSTGTRMRSAGVALAILLEGLTAVADQKACDVLVVGGGSAGVVAAIQAGRLGAKTILVEAGAQMGGATTSGGVNSPIQFSVHGAQRIKGIGWEWIIKTVQLDDGAMPGSQEHWRINAPLFAIVAEELLQQAGVEIRYYEAPSSVAPDQQGPLNWTVTTAAMGETRTIRCKQLIDCTGNGAVCALAGAERMREPEIMPGSINYTIKHSIDMRKIDRAAVEKKFAEAVAKGEMLESDARHGILSSLGYQAGNYVYDADNSTAEARTDTNLRGRQSVLRMLRFIRSLPGGETAQLVAMFPEVGVRETYRVKGEYVITVDDYLSGKVWDDSIAFATYQVDMHKNLWKDFDRRHLAPGVSLAGFAAEGKSQSARRRKVSEQRPAGDVGLTRPSRLHGHRPGCGRRSGPVRQGQHLARPSRSGATQGSVDGERGDPSTETEITQPPRLTVSVPDRPTQDSL